MQPAALNGKVLRFQIRNGEFYWWGLVTELSVQEFVFCVKYFCSSPNRATNLTPKSFLQQWNDIVA